MTCRKCDEKDDIQWGLCLAHRRIADAQWMESNAEVMRWERDLDDVNADVEAYREREESTK